MFLYRCHFLISSARKSLIGASLSFFPAGFLQPSEEKAEDEEQTEEEKEQDKASRTARVQPTPQTREAVVESPSAPVADKKQQPKQ